MLYADFFKWANRHFKRFNEDCLTIPDRDGSSYVEQSVKYIMLGFLYKFILAHIFGHQDYTLL